MEDKTNIDKLYKIFSKESFLFNGAKASGDNSIHCRLCGEEKNLHSFGETYSREGVIQRYSQLVNECFGVEVKPSDEVVCDKCIYKLRVTERFRAQIVAAFAAPIRSKVETREKLSKKYTKKKSTLELLKNTTRTTIDHKWRYQRKSLFNINIQPKKMNLSCSMCRQRYPMMVPFEGWKAFICSRCKKYNMPRTPLISKRNDYATNNQKDRFESHVSKNLTEPRGRGRSFSFNKKPSQISRGDLSNSNFHLHPTRYASRTLSQCCNASIQNDYRCDVCGKEMKNLELLNRHMRTHTGQPLYRCDICRRVFKERISFQKHYLVHGK